ncbi:hypothetical protein EVAR_50588_1 [Eumeta japonica]|uniref:Uncharacterized protein n=1 Tax=Eumeta variegata TaxID=151549 RepID=A0A4C1Y6J5_EUMVA|nr:hypothetical protein EVAR_50588_1 [Eumeta japonica]
MNKNYNRRNTCYRCCLRDTDTSSYTLYAFAASASRWIVQGSNENLDSVWHYIIFLFRYLLWSKSLRCYRVHKDNVWGPSVTIQIMGSADAACSPPRHVYIRARRRPSINTEIYD